MNELIFFGITLLHELILSNNGYLSFITTPYQWRTFKQFIKNYKVHTNEPLILKTAECWTRIDKTRTPERCVRGLGREGLGEYLKKHTKAFKIRKTHKI